MKKYLYIGIGPVIGILLAQFVTGEGEYIFSIIGAIIGVAIVLVPLLIHDKKQPEKAKISKVIDS